MTSPNALKFVSLMMWCALTSLGTAAQTPPIQPEIRPGQFVQRENSRPNEESAIDFQTKEPFSATYIGAPVAQVVNEFLGDFLAVDYSIASDVTGAVTMRVDGISSRLAAIAALRSALQPLGIAVIDRGDVVAVARSTGQAGPVRAAAISPGDPSPSGGGVVVLSPRFILPSQLAPLIAPFAQTEAVVAIDDARRFLIVRGDEATISAASSAAAMFDVDWFSQVSSGMFALKNVAPRDIAAEIKQMLGPRAAAADLIPVPRLSALLVFARSPDVMARIQELVGRLDVPSSDLSPGLLIYRAKHLAADELASALVGVTPVDTAPTSSSASRFSFNEPGRGDEFESAQREATNVTQAASDPNVTFGGVANGFQASANLTQNVVVVRGDAEALADARRLLEALDHPAPQVLVEAAIAEITLNDELEFGVNWSRIQDQMTATFTDAASGKVASRFPGFAFTYVNTDVQTAINVLSAITKVDVISRPSIVALNNETAELQVGDQVPIVTQTAISVANPDAPIVNQTTYRDTGVILVVTPRVRSGGLIELQVAQEVSQVARTTSSGIDSPTIQQRRVASTLVVPSGKSVALGGLISFSSTRSVVGIPLLKDIPLLGLMFRSDSTLVEKTELVVFLTPRLLERAEEAVEATDQIRESFKELEASIARR